MKCIFARTFRKNSAFLTGDMDYWQTSNIKQYKNYREAAHSPLGIYHNFLCFISIISYRSGLPFTSLHSGCMSCVLFHYLFCFHNLPRFFVLLSPIWEKSTDHSKQTMHILPILFWLLKNNSICGASGLARKHHHFSAEKKSLPQEGRGVDGALSWAESWWVTRKNRGPNAAAAWLSSSHPKVPRSWFQNLKEKKGSSL